MKRILTPSIFLIPTLLLFSACSAFAATVNLETRNTNVQTGNEFEVKLFLDSNKEDVNAIEGSVVVPSDLFTVKEIRDGDSVINFWVDRPNETNGVIPFSGIIPGGFNDTKGLLFSIILQPKQEGKAAIAINNLHVLLNDGKGTSTDATSTALSIGVTGQTTGTQPVLTAIIDTEPPEIFTPEVTSDPTMFDGKYFLVFATQDKGSGIDHYEVREGTAPFIIAKSPYLLQNQKLDSDITVLAYDRSGNERMATLPKHPEQPPYLNYLKFGILVAAGLIVIAIALSTLLWRKRKKRH
jgi:hypothetical protein